MKVCTDACILGAWAAEKIKDEGKGLTVLDIGSGTGLLSLMIAQKSSATIEAIEIDEEAFTQAYENFKGSLWSDHLYVLNADARNFAPGKKYDFIITNPPFYEADLLSPKKNKNVAKHDKGLKLEELISIIKNNLNSGGSFAVLLPYHRINYFENIAIKNHFFLKEKLLIKTTVKHNYSRGVLLFSEIENIPVIKELVIKNNGSYSEDFVSLMKDYYIGL